MKEAENMTSQIMTSTSSLLGVASPCPNGTQRIKNEKE